MVVYTDVLGWVTDLFGANVLQTNFRKLTGIWHWSVSKLDLSCSGCVQSCICSYIWRCWWGHTLVKWHCQLWVTKIRWATFSLVQYFRVILCPELIYHLVFETQSIWDFSCWADEDFIGRISRLSRTVHPTQSSFRCIQKALGLYKMQFNALNYV